MAREKERIEKALRESDDKITPRRFIIRSSTSKFKNNFEVVIMLLAIWNAIWTPLTIAFDRAAELSEGDALSAIDRTVDGIFVLDIIIGFLSSYIDVANGDEIFDPMMIAKNYMLKGTFFVDFVSTFPFTEVGELFGAQSF